jgi:hypothetical protein
MFFMTEQSRKYYDPMAETSLDDDGAPVRYKLDANGDIIPDDQPAQPSNYSRAQERLKTLHQEFQKDKRSLSDYGHDLLG